MVVRQLHPAALEELASGGCAATGFDHWSSHCDCCSAGAVASQSGRQRVAGASQYPGHLAVASDVVVRDVACSAAERCVDPTSSADVFGWFAYGYADCVGGLEADSYAPIFALHQSRERCSDRAACGVGSASSKGPESGSADFDGAVACP